MPAAEPNMIMIIIEFIFCRFLLVDFGLSHHVDCIQNTNDATVIIKTDRKRVLDPLEKVSPTCIIESFDEIRG